MSDQGTVIPNLFEVHVGELCIMILLVMVIGMSESNPVYNHKSEVLIKSGFWFISCPHES